VSAAGAAVLLPLLAALGLGFGLTPLRGAYANAGVSALVFGLTLAVPFSPGGLMLHADALGDIFGILTGFAAFTTAVTNIAFVRGELEQFSRRRWRVYHAMSQVLIG
jgi:hydrogenase-4 component F